MPFDNLKNAKIEKLNLALLAFFTLLSLFFVFFIPIFGIAGIIFLPVPATLLVMAGRIRDSVICVVIACIFLVLIDYLIAPVLAVAAILTLAISFIYRSSVRRNKSKFFTVGCIFAGFLGALLLYFIIISAVNGINYTGDLIKNYNNYIDEVLQPDFVKQYWSLFSIEDLQLEPVLAGARDVLKFIVYVVPGILTGLFAFASFMNYIVTGSVLGKYGISIKRFPPFKEWDIPWYWCWGAILGLILVLVPSGNQILNRIYDIAGFNLLAVFGLLYMILGISVLWGLMEKFKVSFVWRVIIFIILGLFINFSIFFIPFIGLIDVWANFRKLKRD
jgi:uncharacterized protein YybS (DUF2232 family)